MEDRNLVNPAGSRSFDVITPSQYVVGVSKGMSNHVAFTILPL